MQTCTLEYIYIYIYIYICVLSVCLCALNYDLSLMMDGIIKGKCASSLK